MIPAMNIRTSDGPDLPETSLDYLRDAYVRSFEATVSAVEADQDEPPTLRRIALDRTHFCPTGGGQPNDMGTLAGRSGSAGAWQ